MMQQSFLRRARACICGVTSLVASGCAPDSYHNVALSVDKFDHLMKLSSPAGIPKDEVVFMELPRAKARFCVQRAIEAYGGSRTSTGVDMAMLIAAGTVAGAGSTVGAASAAMDTSDRKKDMGIASVTFLAAGGALLGLRAALNLSEVGRTQRLAAARDVNTAISIMEKYALADDARAVGDDGFGSCRDQDEAIANSFPGVGSGAATEQVISKAKDSEEKAAGDAVTAKVVAKKADEKADTSKTKVEDLNLTVTRMEQDLGTLRDTKASPAVLASKTEELDKAKADLRAAKGEAAQSEIDAKKAKIESAKADLVVAQAELVTKKAEVLAAGGQLRRAAFYLTGKDVELARNALEDVINEVDGTRRRMKEMQKRVDDLILGL